MGVSNMKQWNTRQQCCWVGYRTLLVCLILVIAGVCMLPAWVQARGYGSADTTLLQSDTTMQEQADSTAIRDHSNDSDSTIVQQGRTGLWGMQFGMSFAILGNGFSIRDIFRGLNTAFSGKYWASESSAWLAGCSINYTNDFSRFHSYEILAGYEYHTTSWDNVSPYIGANATVGIRTVKTPIYNNQTQGQDLLTSVNSYTASATLRVGFEWFILPYLSLSGEQQIAVRYDIQGPLETNIFARHPAQRPPSVAYITTPATFLQLSVYF